MNTRFCWAAALAAAAVTGATASADLVGAIGGQTNVALDFDILSAAAGSSTARSPRAPSNRTATARSGS